MQKQRWAPRSGSRTEKKLWNIMKGTLTPFAIDYSLGLWDTSNLGQMTKLVDRQQSYRTFLPADCQG